MALAVLAALVLACAPTDAAAGAAAQSGRTKPLWEVGVIGGGGLVPGYPASRETNAKGIGSPYLIYRGKFLRVGEKGIVRGRLAQHRNWELDLSVDGSFSSKSDDDKARKGMPDLDTLVEFGPRFQYTLARAARDAKIDFELPVRAVFSVDFVDVGFRGFNLAPRIAYQNENFVWSGLELKLSAGASFVTTRVAEYFYRVRAGHQTLSRPLYEANGGYMGSSVSLVFARMVTRKIKIFVLGVTNFHHGAANENSPLFRDKTTFGIGGALRWSFYRSAKRGHE